RVGDSAGCRRRLRHHGCVGRADRPRENSRQAAPRRQFGAVALLRSGDGGGDLIPPRRAASAIVPIITQGSRRQLAETVLRCAYAGGGGGLRTCSLSAALQCELRWISDDPSQYR